MRVTFLIIESTTFPEIILVIILGILVFVISREISCWYFKIPRVLNQLYDLEIKMNKVLANQGLNKNEIEKS